MKKLGFISRMVYFFNVIFAVLLLVSYFVPMIHPNTLRFFSTMSLLMPVFIMFNILFALYWIFKRNIRFILSLIVLLLGLNHIESLYRLSNTEFQGGRDISLMTYNVRMFNVFGWIDKENIDKSIYSLVKEKNPDLVAFQEFHPMKGFDIGDYKYKYFYYPTGKKYWGQAIFSKYEIVNSGTVNFSSTMNNAVYVDIEVNGKVVRVYSIHLETLKLQKQDLELSKQFDFSDSTVNVSENVKKIATKIDKGFGRHGEQADVLNAHIKNSPHQVIVMGDFNSSAFSYEYSVIKGDLVDAFKEGGKGFGRTYDFGYFPLRIDFILANQEFKLTEFETLNQYHYSDHFPLFASYEIH